MAVDPNWSPVEDLAFVPPNSEQIAVAAAGGVVHLVWAQAKTLYHARRMNDAWTSPIKVAGGEQPALAATPDGGLYCAFANWFLGNREIYVATFAGEKWSLPELVSRTTGASSDPAICAGPDGTLHIVWADATPGYSVIYYSTRSGGAWVNAPIPNGKGSRPTVAANASTVYVAWQDRLAQSSAGAFDVLSSQRTGAGEWTLPDMVSDTLDLHSIIPRIGATAKGHCHLVWQEERGEIYVIRHSDRWPEGWAQPVDVSDPQADARLAFALPNKWGQFQFVWSEGSVLKHRVRPGEPQSEWKPVEVACEDCAGLSELAAAISDKGELHAVFVRYLDAEPGVRRVQYVRRKSIERIKVMLPLVTN
jgi:hypothetical protein